MMLLHDDHKVLGMVWERSADSKTPKLKFIR